MAQRLEQTQAAVQTQQLSSLQVAVAKLVELPVTELATRVRDEMVDNAALEEKDPDTVDTERDLYTENNTPSDTDAEGDSESLGTADDDASPETDTDNSYEEGEDYGREADAMGDYFSSDDVPDYLQQRAEEERDRSEVPFSAQGSFYEDLQRQISEQSLNEHEQQLMEYLIGSLDEDGFLRKDIDALVDELAIYHNITTTRSELEHLLSILQRFDPRGIGARSLQECLHLQLTDPDRQGAYTKLALEVVDKCFKDFVGRRWDTVKRRLNMDDETFDHVRHCLTHLNPRPGSALSESTSAGAPTIVPDFYVRVSPDGESLQVTLNNGDVPELRVSPAFRDSLQQYGGNKTNLTREQRDAYTYARQKVDAAKSFINLLSRRKETLLSVMRCIADRQRDFFMSDDEEEQLHPLGLKEVAERVGVDISTVSRVTSSKYVQTLYGTYPLKYFFSQQFTTTDGDELSARKVKTALRSLIEGEDKRQPLPDEELAQQLKAQGYNVARRTVAKYRDLLGFPTARLRKE